MSVFDAFSLAPADLNKLCRGIIALRAPSPQAQFSSIFPQDFRSNFSVGVGTIGDGLLRWGWCADGTNSLILVGGCQSPTGCQRVVDGYTGGAFASWRNPTNEILEGAASNLHDQMAGLSLWNAANVLIAGYSAGGAVAALTPLYRTVTKSALSEVRIVSFGAPRAASTVRTNLMSEVRQKERYFFYNDPVADFPLRSSVYSFVPFMIGTNAARRWGEFVHHRSGTQINANGSYTFVNDPEGVTITGQTAWGVWWYNQDSTLFGPHDLGLYAAAFEGASAETRTHSVPTTIPQEQADSAGGQDFDRQERASVNAFVDLQEQQNAVQVRIPPERFVRAYRQGRTWFVDFGGVAIMSTPSRRRAQGMAREMNAVLRRMQQTAIVDTAALENQLAEYLRLASDPLSGFQPTMNTRFQS